MSRTWYAIANKTADSADVEIYDEIGGWGVSAKEFIKALAPLSGKHLNLRINSPGGSIIDGQAIIAALKRHTGGFTAWVDGLAASMASVIACAAERCYMADGAMMMIHRASTVSMGDAEDLRKDASLLEKFEKGIVNVYAAKTGMAPEEIQQMLAEETWMDALEAVALGFCDGMTDTPAAMAKVSAADLRARFDTFRSKNMNATTPVTPTPAAPLAQVDGPAGTQNDPEGGKEVTGPAGTQNEPSGEQAPAGEPQSHPEGEPQGTPEGKPQEEPESELQGEPQAEPQGEPAAEHGPEAYERRASAITERIQALSTRAEAAEARAAAHLRRAEAAEKALANLERSLGVAAASPKAQARIEPPFAIVDTMTLEEFRALPHHARNSFLRKGGKLTD
jgi:ATP-dependent protease ClpP protease subunit